MARSLFTSESVSMGHPDKVADQVSDAVLDALLAQDPDKAFVLCEWDGAQGMTRRRPFSVAALTRSMLQQD